MVEIGKYFPDLLVLFYNFGWLVSLTLKHYDQVTNTAGHIFELNVLLNNNISIFLWILLEDLGLKDTLCTLADILQTMASYSMLVAIAGSQIETAIFLKKLSVQTMTTNMAAKIIVVMTIFAAGVGVITTTYSKTECQTKT